MFLIDVLIEISKVTCVKNKGKVKLLDDFILK